MKLSGSIEITKFKLKEDRTVAIIEFNLLSDIGLLCPAKVEIYDAPHPQLLDAFDALMPLAIESHNLDADRWESLGFCTGITLKPDDDGNYGVVLTVQKKALENGAPASVNTLFLKGADVDQGPIEKLVEEIEKYMEGKRAQSRLDLKVA